MSAEDWPSVARIYREGIATGNATFERTVPGWEQWRSARIDDPCLVARGESGEVLGWAALSPVSSRAVYRGVGEVGVYIDQSHAAPGDRTAAAQRPDRVLGAGGLLGIAGGHLPRERGVDRPA